MEKVARAMDKCILYLENWAALAAAGVALGLMLLVSLHAILRYMFDAPFIFTKEYSGYAFVFIVFMTFAYCVRRGAHIRVELVTRYIPKRWRDGLELVTLLAALVLILLFLRSAVYAATECLVMGRESCSSLLTPLWIPYLPLPLGLFLLVLSIVAEMVRKFMVFQKGLKKGAVGGITVRSE